MTDIKQKLVKIDYFLEKYKSTRVSCAICPHRCGADRNTKFGVCKEPYEPRISSFNLHHGEEPPISGVSGSGTIFFSGCNMNCAYCQNFPISQLHESNRQLTIDGLAEVMLVLQKKKAHNINFVTPSHYVYQIAEALKTAFENGLNIPLVYNTSGYDRSDVIKDLDGIMDIYLPDAKYVSPEISKKYSNTGNYFEENSLALIEMHNQTRDDLAEDENGIAQKGMIIRHLVLPDNTENSKQVLQWLHDNLSNRVHLAIMAQYFPAYRISESYCPELNRKISRREYEEVLTFAEDLGFENAWFQEYQL